MAQGVDGNDAWNRALDILAKRLARKANLEEYKAREILQRFVWNVTELEVE